MTSYLKIWGPFGRQEERLKHSDLLYQLSWGFIAVREDYDMAHLTLFWAARERKFTFTGVDVGQREVGGMTAEIDVKVYDVRAWVDLPVHPRPIPGKIIPVLSRMLAPEDHAKMLAGAIEANR